MEPHAEEMVEFVSVFVVQQDVGSNGLGSRCERGFVEVA